MADLTRNPFIAIDGNRIITSRTEIVPENTGIAIYHNNRRRFIPDSSFTAAIIGNAVILNANIDGLIFARTYRRR